MKRKSKLTTTIYIEAFGDLALPLFSAQTALSAVRSHSFSTARDGQTSIDIHLLFGDSNRASENTSIGRWQIAGIPPSKAGQPYIRVDIRVNAQGKAYVSATLDGKRLHVSLLTDHVARVPVEAWKGPADALGSIRQQINTGQRKRARLELANLLWTEPHNVTAWALLATLLEDPIQRADCYRQILRLDPDHRLAAARLQVLTGQGTGPVDGEAPSPPEGVALICQQCWMISNVQIGQESNDKRVVCPHCGSEANLPDTPQHREPKAEHHQSAAG